MGKRNLLIAYIQSFRPSQADMSSPFLSGERRVKFRDETRSADPLSIFKVVVPDSPRRNEQWKTGHRSGKLAIEVFLQLLLGGIIKIITVCCKEAERGFSGRFSSMGMVMR
ncbi:hypothetical protein H6P81_015516 [Aristolochia fimbriata]|uniref:Uncharacterized protein n=1 Tax=Aristolochia fimbriata TaxID=158543 RepID=A0AAV7E8N5_ARIFI|nr:hypothetical protein H6P81_015516 [Aristolochia fimbriata]